MCYLLIVKKDKNRFIVHGSQSKTWLLKNQDIFLNKKDYSRYPHLLKAFDGELPRKTKNNPLVFCVVEKYLDGTFDVPFISFIGSSADCKRYVKSKTQYFNMTERAAYRYNIVLLTASNYEDFEEDINWLNHVDEDGRIQCYYDQRFSGEYDIYSYLTDGESRHLGYVDNYKELVEYFEDNAIKDRYFCPDI